MLLLLRLLLLLPVLLLMRAVVLETVAGVAVVEAAVKFSRWDCVIADINVERDVCNHLTNFAM